MVSFTLQVLLSLLVLLSIRGLDRRKIWLLLPLTFLPDLDYAVGVHREWLHNVWILLPSLALVVQGWRTSNREWIQWGVISATYLGSHVGMDVFVGGATLLWPLTDYNFCAYFAINVITRTNTPVFDLGNCSAPGAPTVSELYPWLDYQETAAWVFVLSAAFAVALWSELRRRGMRLPWEESRGP